MNEDEEVVNNSVYTLNDQQVVQEDVAPFVSLANNQSFEEEKVEVV